MSGELEQLIFSNTHDIFNAMVNAASNTQCFPFYLHSTLRVKPKTSTPRVSPLTLPGFKVGRSS